MPVSYASPSAMPAVYVIHENADWTAPLYKAFDSLGVAYHDWNLAQVSLDLSQAAPDGIFL